MSFDEFENQARLYVIGALEPEETEEFERPAGSLDKKRKTASPNVTRCTKRLRSACGPRKLRPR